MKKYSIISILFIAIIGLFIYLNSNASTTYNIFGIQVTLYDALWSVLFLTIFYLISISYFGLEKFRQFSFKRTIQKDRQNIFKNIENKILYKDKLLKIKELTEFEEIVEMLNGDKLTFKKSEKFPFLEELAKIQNEEVADLSKLKLDKENPWYMKNLENKIKAEDLEAAKEALNTPLKEKALELLSKKAELREILANDYPITKETILNNLDSNRLKELIDKSNLSNKDYIEIAQILHKNTKVPETLLELFENKLIAYIYLLIEYEMIDKAYELAKEKEIKFFEYYLLLRKNGIKVDIKEYLNASI